MPDINSAMSMSSATEAVVTSGYRGSGILDVTEKFAYASATTAMNGATDISQSFGTLGSPPVLDQVDILVNQELMVILVVGAQGSLVLLDMQTLMLMLGNLNLQLEM